MKLIFCTVSLIIITNCFAATVSSLDIGDYVIDNQNRVGLVSTIFKNQNKVVIQFLGKRLDYEGGRLITNEIKLISDLSKKVSCYKEFCQGDEVVVNGYNEPLLINRIFENGKIEIDDNVYLKEGPVLDSSITKHLNFIIRYEDL